MEPKKPSYCHTWKHDRGQLDGMTSKRLKCPGADFTQRMVRCSGKVLNNSFANWKKPWKKPMHRFSSLSS